MSFIHLHRKIPFSILKIADDNPNPFDRVIKNEIPIEIEDDGKNDQNGAQSGNQTADKRNEKSVQEDATDDSGNGIGPKCRNNLKPVIRLDRCDKEGRAKLGAKKSKQIRQRRCTSLCN